MTEPVEPEPEPAATPQPDPWAEATPRLKAIFKESIEEWFAENDAAVARPEPEEEEPVNDEPIRPTPRPKRPLTTGSGGGGNGSPAPAPEPKLTKAGTRRGQATASGGSILDVLLGR